MKHPLIPPPTKSLYRCAKHTEVSNDLYEQTRKAINPIFDAWIEAGYSPREISHVMIGVIFDLECEAAMCIQPTTVDIIRDRTNANKV